MILNMSQKEKNIQAVDDYVYTKTLDVDNGNTRIFCSDISYINHKTGEVSVLKNTKINVSTVYPYGGYAVSIAGLQDIAGCFVEHNTNFNLLSFTNGQLTIKGKDNTGTKGDFTLVLL